ncbi:unnamed protein product [Rotaria sordida]|uniref:TIL domain-containing protein n=1 Tax=Rotaria sordida TaxID=392033 RepID=A0A814DVH0_9BILA|nr:unnamed protein product [Rotaria sordida]CAF1011212.1 unnamed protein product [Rotaria sordida]CAF4031760.1 unnamed protein product [Rotaria sordida]
MAYALISFIVLALFMSSIIECRFVNYEICGPNEEYNRCGTQCEQTCNNIDRSQHLCNHMCAIGCFCIDGYVRQSDKNSLCVRINAC